MAKTKKSVLIGVVLPDFLNVRVEPKGKVLDVIKKGTVVNVVSKKNGWFNVTIDDLSGWVNGDYLAVKEAT